MNNCLSCGFLPSVVSSPNTYPCPGDLLVPEQSLQPGKVDLKLLEGLVEVARFPMSEYASREALLGRRMDEGIYANLVIFRESQLTGESDRNPANPVILAYATFTQNP